MKSKLFTATALLLMLFVSISIAQDYKIPETFVEAKADQVVSDRARDFLEDKYQENGKIRIWVYFTDKGFSTEQEFIGKAQDAYNSMTSRTIARRAKNNAAAITFKDLPVETNYIEQIKALGLHQRRVSKWLNAASFETTPDKLDLIKDLPFVKEIIPVASIKNKYPADNDIIEGDSESTRGNKLNYANSEGQLAMINVPAVHSLDYSGQGVIVAMFDTGFRKSHQAFADIMISGRLLAEHDFVFDDGQTANEAQDVSDQWSHGTKTWSILGGGWDGYIYGPAYGASFVLCKTEDTRSETAVEEDNWVAAAEWVDSIGVDVISSSLGYLDWYTSSDFDGNTCATTIAADQAAQNGIVVCNSAGNEGSGSSTIIAPADADSIITVGAVYSSGTVTYFSSRGPTADGRTKPEVMAQGYDVTLANYTSNTAMSTGPGTSFSCPLVGGCAALILEAHPNWTVMQVREAMMMTADNAETPNNTYGWGIIDVLAAINYSFFPFQKGDANNDEVISISDAVYIINYVFSSGPEPLPEELAGDANDDDNVNVSDAIYIVNYIFLPGSPPPPGY